MIELRPFGDEGSSRLLHWVRSERELIQWAGSQLFRFPLTEEQLLAYLRAGKRDPPASRIFEAFDTLGGVVVGHCELGAINRSNRTATLCRILVDPARRGTGICLPMVKAALRFGFEEENLRRIELRVYSFNESAIRCYERAGFQREGYLRRAQLVGDEVWDVVVMGILKEEWLPSDR
jgi:RimJ/RimL family protein N-acetyltransferase